VKQVQRPDVDRAAGEIDASRRGSLDEHKANLTTKGAKVTKIKRVLRVLRDLRG
jgi:hypothetical protein